MNENEGMGDSDDPPWGHRELFTHRLGQCYRTQINTGTEEKGYWVIEDLDLREVGSIQKHPDGWKSCTPYAGLPQGAFESFAAALNSHVAAIAETGGVQTDELFWQGAGLPRWA